MSDSEPEKMKSGIRGAIISLLILYIGFAIGRWAEERDRHSLEKHRAQMRLQWDIKWTGPSGHVHVEREEDGSWKRYFHTRFTDEDGIHKVQIQDLDGKLIWGQSLDEYEPVGNMWSKNQAGHFTNVWLSVPKMEDGTYLIIVFDQNGNSFSKEVLFEDK